jgi:WD40 repeat protein
MAVAHPAASGSARGSGSRRHSSALARAAVFVVCFSVAACLVYSRREPWVLKREVRDYLVANYPAISPDNSRLVTGRIGPRLVLRDIDTGREVASHLCDTGCVWFTPDGRRIAAVTGYKSRILFWDIQTGQLVVSHEIDESQDTTCAAVSADRRLVGIATRDDNVVRIWDTRAREEVATLKGHTKRVTSISFSRDGLRVLTAAQDESVRVWNAETGERFSSLEGIKSYSIGGLISPDGRRAAAVFHGRGERPRIWPVDESGPVCVLEGYKYAVARTGFSGNSKYAYTVGGEELSLWETSTGLKQRGTFSHSLAPVISRDGRLALTAQADHSANVWNLDSCEKVCVLIGHRDSIRAAAFSHDRERVVTGSKDGTVRIWDAKTGKELVVLSRDKGRELLHYAFSSDGTTLAASAKATYVWWHGSRSSTGGRDERVCVWRRRHPERWWGHFLRPETIAALALGALFAMEAARLARSRRAAPKTTGPNAPSSGSTD